MWHRHLDLSIDAQPRTPSEPIAERGERAGEPEVLERLGAEVGRDASDVLEACARRVLRFAQFPAQVIRQALFEPAQLEEHRGQCLPDLVVQLLGDPQALGLVCGEHSARRLVALQLQPREHLVEGDRELAGLRGKPGS